VYQLTNSLPDVITISLFKLRTLLFKITLNVLRRFVNNMIFHYHFFITLVSMMLEWYTPLRYHRS